MDVVEVTAGLVIRVVEAAEREEALNSSVFFEEAAGGFSVWAVVLRDEEELEG